LVQIRRCQARLVRQFATVLLIWINRRSAEFADLSPMTSRPRPTIRHCPLCGIAMQASKTRENLTDFDLFRCLSCDTTISESRTRPPADDKNSG
jgi:hypothetical protein